MNSTLEMRKVIIGIILTILWMCIFLFIKSTLVIDWVGDGSVLTPLKSLLILIGLLIIFFFNLFYPSNTETSKLSWTATFTIAWLALIIFYPFKTDVAYGGAVGFFTLVGGLAVCILWIRFFSDEIFA